MAHIKRTIEVNAPVDSVHEQWLRFEAMPASGYAGLVSRVRWRAEVLTFEPIPSGTRVILKIEFDPAAADPALEARMDRVLQRFARFVGGGQVAELQTA